MENKHLCKFGDELDTAYCEKKENEAMTIRVESNCCGCGDIVHIVNYCPVCGEKDKLGL